MGAAVTAASTAAAAWLAGWVGWAGWLAGRQVDGRQVYGIR